MTKFGYVPDHVPPERVWDGDFFAYMNELDDPYLASSRMHDGPEVVWVTNASYGFSCWMFTSHAAIEEGFGNAKLFSSRRGALNAAVMDPGWPMIPVETDAPEHTQYREILRPFFTPKAIEQRLGEVEGLCNTLIDSFIERGTCDFIADFAEILPNAITVSMLGMPAEMLRQFLTWEAQSIHAENNTMRAAAGNAIRDYIETFVNEQRRNPTSEIMQVLMQGRMKDRPLTHEEIRGTVYLLFVAGLDTVFSTLGWVMRHLATDQALQTRLRNNPELIPQAREEFSRAFGVSAPFRIVAEDMVYRGATMKKGEDVLLPTYLAGRDPRAWENPHVIDIDRKPKHVTFGNGQHICIGIHLAKREIQSVISNFLRRMKNIRIAPGDSFAYQAGSTLGVSRLILEWDKI